MAKTKAEKIMSIEEEIRQLENKKKRLIQEQKEQERKDRTNRLCKRMGLFEKLLSDTILLTEEQFKTFLEQTVLTEHSRRILDGLTAQNDATAPAQGAETAVQGTPYPPSKPPIQRRRTEQTRARCKGNGPLECSREGVSICQLTHPMGDSFLDIQRFLRVPYILQVAEEYSHFCFFYRDLLQPPEVA